MVEFPPFAFLLNHKSAQVVELEANATYQAKCANNRFLFLKNGLLGKRRDFCAVTKLSFEVSIVVQHSRKMLLDRPGK